MILLYRYTQAHDTTVQVHTGTWYHCTGTHRHMIPWESSWLAWVETPWTCSQTATPWTVDVWPSWRKAPAMEQTAIENYSNCKVECNGRPSSLQGHTVRHGDCSHCNATHNVQVNWAENCSCTYTLYVSWPVLIPHSILIVTDTHLHAEVQHTLSVIVIIKLPLTTL